MNPPNHLRFIVGCLTLMAMAFAGIGGYLLLKGFQSGELFVTIVGSIAGGIGGMLAMSRGSNPPTPPGIPVDNPQPPDRPAT